MKIHRLALFWRDQLACCLTLLRSTIDPLTQAHRIATYSQHLTAILRDR